MPLRNPLSLEMGGKGNRAFQSKTHCLVLTLGPRDTLGPTKGISGLPVDPLEDTRATSLHTHTQASGMPLVPALVSGKSQP